MIFSPHPADRFAGVVGMALSRHPAVRLLGAPSSVPMSALSGRAPVMREQIGRDCPGCLLTDWTNSPSGHTIGALCAPR
jgi:hypothetical protein